MTLRIAPRPAEGAATDVVAFGENSVDLVVRLRLPLERGSKVPVDAITERSGGQALTAAVACARLGWRACCAGVTGDDERAAAVRRTLEAAGVEPQLIRRPGGATRSALVLVEPDTGDRTVLEHRAVALSLTEDETPVWLAASGRVLLVDAADVPASTRMARAAHGAGVPVIVDVDRDAEGVAGLLEAIDVLVVPESFAVGFTGRPAVGEAVAGLARRFEPAIVIATLGPEGSLALVEGHEMRTPAPRIEPVDTTGAGDAFRAGFASAWLELGAAAPVEALLRRANVLAALSCLGEGALGGLPRRADLDRYL